MRTPTVFLILTLVFAACREQARKPEPPHIEVQHILIGFYGSLPGRSLNRPQSEASALAQQVLQQARQGADFDALVRQYSNDEYPGRFKLANHGVAAGEGEYERRMMVAGFGEVAFQLAVGEIGLVEYDAAKSPYGWHIVKRLQ
ncbi:MAG: peptidyl-prolyl cis-trans isomerase [candidate division KSB1 bacterium]|nr:peptidyl-prolyl cis-trans isomerase [candidate division KSB1 bacterium]MDZ7275498.1 peptidyl-prolyl cis-trans isomerase [candidate division KSB1 bacterium]MDZ7286190.1 peptidyl-prolyl cis-trans isomerase [candidate division KSB1 bacterium]MDZ7296416.1 peptidyl-prolyl cis-trans isomerase [candidate division KSB1 bacterium]MDZ7308946.1 peptidyl-prolyl cis-trans isomerase [candidate division KSB1 bacterium]